MTSRSEVLNEAMTIVNGQREEAYGTPERNFERIAQMWSAYMEITIHPHDVAAMMAMLKIARIRISPDRLDHWIDLAGYAACGGEVKPSE